MDIRVLDYFLLTAREENITKAAELLHLTQPTLSRRLKALESELGVTLFERHHHSVSLTNEGLLFRRRAQDIVNMASRAQDELQASDELAGEIAIGCSELQSMSELAKMMGAFQRQHPLVRFALHSGNNEDIRAWLEQGTIDLGLLIEPVDTSRYESVALHQEEVWGILAHENSPFSKYDAIRPGDLVGTPVITILDTVVQKELVHWSGDYAKDMGNWARYNLLYNAAMLAQQNCGVVICLKLDQHFDHLRFVPLEPKLALHSLVAWRGQQPHSKATAAFIAAMQQSAMQ